MCLIINREKTERYKKKKGFVWGYKILKKDREDLYSCFYGDKIWRPGFVYSDRKNKSLDFDERAFGEIYKGIHVYTKPKKRSVKVKCYIKDLIAVGYDDAAFMKVFLPKSEYLKGIKNGKTR